MSTSLLPPIPPNDASRIAALRAYDILGTAEEDIFNSITRSAADVCSTPMASLSFVDEDEQYFKSSLGMTQKGSSRAVSFCAHAVHGQNLVVVENATDDPRFRDNPFVIGPPNVCFYAGMPLVAPSGLSIGTLCVFDTVPRTLIAEQAHALMLLAESAMRVLNLRRNVGAALFFKAVDMTCDGITIAAASSAGAAIVYANESFLRFTGYQYHQTLNQPCTFPAAGSPSVSKAFDVAFAKGQMTTVEYQFRKNGGGPLWDRVSFLPYVDENANLVYIVGIHRDITHHKEAEVQSQQLHAMRTTMATVDHVVKNFMNAAQLYSFQITSGANVKPEMQGSFDAALQNTRLQLAAIHRMPAFKDRPTPFGISLLDADDRN